MNMAKNLWTGLLTAIVLGTMLVGVASLSADEPGEKKAAVKGSGDDVQQKLQAMREEADRLLKEGKKEEAHKLLHQAEELARSIKGKGDPHAGASEGAKQKIHAIREEAERLQKEGKKEEAHKLLHQAEELARNIKGKGDPHAGASEGAKEKLHAIREEAAKLLKEGNKEGALKLQQHAEDLERNIKGKGDPHAGASEGSKQKLVAIQEQIERLQKEGKKEEAQKLAQLAEELARNVKGKGEPKDKGEPKGKGESKEKGEPKGKSEPKGKGEPKGDSNEALRAELKQVQNELREVREQLRKLLELQRKDSDSK